MDENFELPNDLVLSSYEYRDRLAKEPPLDTHFTGLGTLDKITGGFSPGQMIAVSGWTKSGKTSVCQTLTYLMSLMGIHSLWFTYEVPPSEFFKKFPEGQLPLFYLPEVLKSTDLSWIEKKIAEAKTCYDCKMVFIDHLHFLVPLGGHNNMSIIIGGVMRELKKMALALKVVIFILCHTQKIKADEKPGLEHIRDSSFIAQESDLVLMISRPHYNEDDEESANDTSARLRVLANRKTGMRGVVKLNYTDGLYVEEGV